MVKFRVLLITEETLPHPTWESFMNNKIRTLVLFIATTMSLHCVGQTINFSVQRGFYTSSFSLNISKSFSGGNIRYTTDGSKPTTSSGTIYSGSISITTTTVIRAIGYNGGTVTPVETQTYLFLDDVIEQPANISGWPNNTYELGMGTATAVHDYEMDPDVVNSANYSSSIIPGLQEIPTLSVVMPKNDFWTMYDGEDEFETSVELLFADNPSNNEQFDCGIESHSHLRLKRSMRLVFDNAYFSSLTSNIIKSAPYNSTATDHFDNMKIVLRGGNNRAWSRNWNPNRTCFTRDEWYRQSLYEATGIGGRGNFYHLYVNGLYWGMFNAVERPDHGFLAEYLGGDSDDYLSNYHDGVRSGDQTRYNYLTTQLVNKDMNVLSNYQELTQYLDVNEFSDYLAITFFTGMDDWPGNNFYGGNRNVPPTPQQYYGWDCEKSWDQSGSNQGAWVHPDFEASESGGPEIAKLFHVARQSDEFLTVFADRVYKQCFNDGPLTDDNSRARWQMLNNYISNAVIAESARWGDATGTTRTKNGHWQPEVNRVDGLMNGNVVRFINALRAEGYYPDIDPPLFNQESGSVTSSFSLTMSNPNGAGTIYYTTNGSDPRAAGGNVSGSASSYSSGVSVGSGLNVKARVKNGSEWSALHEGAYTVSGGPTIANLFINEFIASNDAGITDEAGELEDWIEIYNGGSNAVNIGGLYITDDLSDPTKYQIPTSNPGLTTIAPGGFLLLWADEDLGQGILHVDIKLSAGGEAIGLVQMASGTPYFIDQLTFGAQTADVSTGRYPDGAASFITFTTPTPNASNTLPFAEGLYINEFLASNVNDSTDEAGDHEDWIEIYNSNNDPIDVGGFYITDDLSDPLKFQLPTNNAAATTIPGKGFLLLWADNELGEGPLHISPKLGKSGEAIGFGQVVGGTHQYLDSIIFGAQVDDISTGRFPDGANNLITFTSTTPGASNGALLISGLFINEFLASNDNDITDEAGDHEDWIEIYNDNDFAVDLGGLYLTDDLSDPLKFQIPATNPAATTITAKGFLLFWADDELGEGPLHISPKLGKSGEAIGLVQVQSGTPVFIDSLTFGAQTDDISTGRYPDGAPNLIAFGTTTPGLSNSLPFVSGLYINEFLASNVNDSTDEAGDHEDWIEIYNSNNTPVDIGGFYITDDLSNMTKFQLPTADPGATTIPAKGFLLLWADDELGEGPLHISPKLGKGGEAIGLVQGLGGAFAFIDSLTFGAQSDDVSTGRYPDGSSSFIGFTSTTPGSSNILPLVSGLFINEYLASNDASVQDEFGGNDDWFELYNSTADPVNIGGLFVTDNIGTPNKWQIPTNDPAATTIAPGGFMVIWADEETHQGPLHTDIKLSAGGEAIALVQINGTEIFFIDSLTFPAQVTDRSEGRYPDGSSTIVPFAQMTPGASNVLINDCNGDLGGFAFIDSCGVCAGGNTGIVPDSCVTVCEENEVISFTLMHSGNGGEIGPLTNNTVINKMTIGSFSIRANVCADPVGSVRFNLNGTNIRTESVSPYAINGDNNGNYTAWNPSVGSYTLTATPYTGSGGSGSVGIAETITFTVINEVITADCNGDENGTAFLDDCGVCSGGNSGHAANSDKDDCDVCNGNNASKDCNGDCSGSAFMDGCGTCVGGNTGLTACVTDCNGDLNGTAVLDDCEICSGGNSGHVANSDKDDCDVCNGNNSDQDCNGDCFGSASIDNCNVCSGGNTGITPNSTCSPPCVQNEVISFTLMHAGSAGEIAPLTNGMVINKATTGSFSIRANVCSDPVGSVRFHLNGTNIRTENVAPYSINGDNNGNYTAWNPSLGSYILIATPYSGSGASGTTGVTETVTFTVVNQTVNTDCNGDLNGTAVLDACGICSGGNSGHVANSDKDECGVCNGNNAAKDCNGDCFGTASVDGCNVCSGGNTGITPNSTCTPPCVANEVVSLTLVRPGNNGEIGLLTNGMTINESSAGNFNIRADLCSGPVGSVKFYVNGSFYATENVSPYALAGDNNGSFYVWKKSTGNYTVQAVPYSGSNGNGTMGISLTRSFTVVNTGAAKTSGADADIYDVVLTASPNPFKNKVIIGCMLPNKQRIKLEVMSLDGRSIKIIHQGLIDERKLYQFEFEAGDMTSGMYFYRLITEGGEVYNRKLMLVK